MRGGHGRGREGKNFSSNKKQFFLVSIYIQGVMEIASLEEVIVGGLEFDATIVEDTSTI